MSQGTSDSPWWTKGTVPEGKGTVLDEGKNESGDTSPDSSKMSQEIRPLTHPSPDSSRWAKETVPKKHLAHSKKSMNSALL